jgi:hypothetical protein
LSGYCEQKLASITFITKELPNSVMLRYLFVFTSPSLSHKGIYPAALAETGNPHW